MNDNLSDATQTIVINDGLSSRTTLSSLKKYILDHFECGDYLSLVKDEETGEYIFTVDQSGICEELKNGVELQEATINQLKSSVINLDQKDSMIVGQVEQETQERQSAIQSVNDRIDYYISEVASLQTKVESESSDMSTVKRELDAIRYDIQKLYNKLSDIELMMKNS